MRPGIGSHHDQSLSRTRSGNAATVKLTLVLHHETEAAILVSETGERDRTVWLPKSQIEWRRTDKTMFEVIVEVECPEWLANKKGLI